MNAFQEQIEQNPMWRAYIAPAVLCSVALVCLFRVVAYDQSPWKGGGFGMFSTLETPQARYLKVFLVAGPNEIPVEIPETLKKDVARMQTVPSESQLESIGNRLAMLDWKDELSWWQNVSDQWNDNHHDQVDGPFDAQHLKKLISSSSSSTSVVLPRGSKRKLKSVGASAVMNEADRCVRYDSVRVELWRSSFDSSSNSMSVRKVMESTHRYAGASE